MLNAQFAFSFDALPTQIHGASVVSQLSANGAADAASGVMSPEAAGHGLVTILTMLAFGSISYKSNPFEGRKTKRGRALHATFSRWAHVKVKHGHTLARADLETWFHAVLDQVMSATSSNGNPIFGAPVPKTAGAPAEKTAGAPAERTKPKAKTIINDRWNLPLSSTVARFDKFDDLLSSGAMPDEITHWLSNAFSISVNNERNRFAGVQSAQIAHAQRQQAEHATRVESLMRDREALETALFRMGEMDLRAVMAKMGYRVSRIQSKKAA